MSVWMSWRSCLSFSLVLLWLLLRMEGEGQFRKFCRPASVQKHHGGSEFYTVLPNFRVVSDARARMECTWSGRVSPSPHSILLRWVLGCLAATRIPHILTYPQPQPSPSPPTLSETCKLEITWRSFYKSWDKNCSPKRIEINIIYILYYDHYLWTIFVLSLYMETYCDKWSSVKGTTSIVVCQWFNVLISLCSKLQSFQKA